MAYSLLRGCHQRYDIKGVIGVAPNPSSWTSLADLCQDFVKCLNSHGDIGPRVLIHVFLPGTRISLDIGDVKAAGFLCVLGISFGIGSYVLYRIYDRYIRPVFWPRQSSQSDGEETEEEEADEETMGNEQSAYADIPVYYQRDYGVSLYKPVEKPRVTVSDNYILRNRNIGLSNGGVKADVGEEALLSDEGSISEQLNGNHKNHARDFRDLRIEIDESGFIEDENDIDVNPPSLSNSLKGNFSPRSLYEKTRQFNSETSNSDEDCVCIKEKSDSIAKSKCDKVEEIKENKLPKADFDNLTPNSNLDTSSVLLTPPPEDELSSVQPFSTSSARESVRSTKSDISDIHSEIVDTHDSDFHEHNERYSNCDINETGVLTDDDQEAFSPLPYDNTAAEKSTVQSLQVNALISKLNEIKSRSRCSSESSPTKTSSDTFSYPEHRRVASLGSKENTFSGISSPELELLNTETKQISVVTSGAFETLESEIHDVEDEFFSIGSQIQDLNSKCLNCDTSSNAGLEILDSIYRRYPSIRVRHKNKGIQSTNYTISNYVEHDTYQDSDLESVVETDGADLSWDLENILEMLYSETSESGSMQNPVVKKLSKMEKMRSESNSPVDFLEKNSFDTTVEMDGSLYEDDFHLQLGTLPSSYTSMDSQHSREGTSCHQDEEPGGQQGETSQPGETIQSEETSQPGETSQPVETSQPGKTSQPGEISQLGETHTGEDANSVRETTCKPKETTSRNKEPTKPSVCNIGTKILLTEYAEREWRGKTPKAKLMKKAYAEIPRQCQCCHLRQIRGDNYCAIRGTVFQCFVNNLPPFPSSSKESVIEKLSQTYNDPSSGLSHWTFGNRLSFTKENRLEVMSKCIDCLYRRFEELKRLGSHSEREEFVADLLNSSSQCDIEIMEGIKLLMLLKAQDLYNDMTQENEVPVYVWLMFARDTSENMDLFVKNHLNPVGDSGGLEQVEMFLLGYTLGVRIQVFRLSQFGQSDFISYYPDDCSDNFQTVTLLAEDDRHYNVPVL